MSKQFKLAVGYVEHRFRAGCKNTSLNASGSVVGMELDVVGIVVLCRRFIKHFF